MLPPRIVTELQRLHDQARDRDDQAGREALMRYHLRNDRNIPTRDVNEALDEIRLAQLT